MDLAPIDALHPTFHGEHGLLVLTLEHGKANEIGTTELAAFAALCDLAQAHAEIVCVCTTSRRVSAKGTPVFLAGANVTERVGWTDDRVRAHVIHQRGVMQRLRRLPVFTIAVSHGVTLGWGLEFCLTADRVLATDHASFALPETGLGILPGAGGTAWLAERVGVAETLRLGCSGETITTAEAHRIGLVDEIVHDVDHGLERARTLAALLGRRSPTAIAAFKRAVRGGLGHTEDERLALEREAYEHTLDNGDAAIGRARFASVRAGEVPPWPPRRS